jgi:hypothetical protein
MVIAGLESLVEAMEAVREGLVHPPSVSGPRTRSVPTSRPPVSIEALSWLDEVERTVLAWFDRCVTTRPRPPAPDRARQAVVAVVELGERLLEGHPDVADEVRATVPGLVARGQQVLGERARPRPLPVKCPECATPMVLVDGYSPAGGWPRCPKCKVTRTDLVWLGLVVGT